MRIGMTHFHLARQLAGFSLAAALGFAPVLHARGKKVEVGPEAAAKFKLQAEEAKGAGKLDSALKLYRQAAEADPSNNGNAEDYGRALIGAGKFKDAAELFRALTMKDDPAANWNLGYALVKQGDFKGAAEAYAGYTHVMPDDPDGYYQLAECLRKLERFPEAAAQYDLYIQKETRASEQAFVTKAKTRSAEMKAAAPVGSGPVVADAKTGAPASGITAAPSGPVVVSMPGATTAPAAAPSPATATAAAPAASAPVTVAAPAPAAAPVPAPITGPARDPNAAIARIREGDVLFKQGHFREALFSYQDAAKLDDQSTNALLKQGLAYANMNYFKEAVDKWSRVLQIDPKNQYAPKYIEKARPHLAAGEAGKADPAAPTPVQATNILTTGSGSSSVTAASSAATRPVTAEDEAAAKDLYRKAVQLMNTQKYDDAIAQLNNALEKNPGYVNGYIARGGARFGLKRYTEAINDYQKALQLNPNLATPVYGLGRSYDKLGDKLNACSQYRSYVRSTSVDVQPTLKKQAQDQLINLCGETL